MLVSKILKKELWIRISCLVLIGYSVFLRSPHEKTVLVITGISGLLLISILKKQKALAIIYFLLIAIAASIYLWYFSNLKLSF